MTFDEFAKEIDMDVTGTLNRFSGNAELMQHFVRTFPDDKTFPQLQAAIAVGNWSGIEEAAHTLKGVSGNLGFSTLFTLTSEIVNDVRTKQFDAATALFPKAIECCQHIIDCINKLDG